MVVYHGSYVEVRQIDLDKCEPHRDFGQGFYVTKFRHHAENWAKRKSRFTHNGFVSEYEFHYSALVTRNCKIKQFENYGEEWLDFVVLNRNDQNPVPAHDYDIVEGPVADDKVQNRIENYLDGEITKADFLEELRWHEETHQICFCSIASLQFLKRMDNGKRISRVSHINEPVIERLVKDFSLDDKTAAETFFTSATFSRLSDASTGLFEKPWTEIYEMLKKEKEGDADE